MHRPPKKISTLAIASMLAMSGALGVNQPALLSRPEGPKPAAAHITRRNRKRLSGSAKKQRERQEINASGRANNKSWFKKMRSRLGLSDQTRDRAIQTMTNWQNHQWIKAGCPRNYEDVIHYRLLKRR